MGDHHHPVYDTRQLEPEYSLSDPSSSTQCPCRVFPEKVLRASTAMLTAATSQHAKVCLSVLVINPKTLTTARNTTAA